MCFNTGKGAECAVQLQTAYYEALLLLENDGQVDFRNILLLTSSDFLTFRHFLFVGFLTLLPPQHSVIFVQKLIDLLFSSVIFWGGVGGCAFFPLYLRVLLGIGKSHRSYLSTSWNTKQINQNQKQWKGLLLAVKHFDWDYFLGKYIILYLYVLECPNTPKPKSVGDESNNKGGGDIAHRAQYPLFNAPRQ